MTDASRQSKKTTVKCASTNPPDTRECVETIQLVDVGQPNVSAPPNKDAGSITRAPAEPPIQ